MHGSGQHNDQPHQRLSDTITTHKLQHTAISTKKNDTHEHTHTHNAHLQQAEQEQPRPAADRYQAYLLSLDLW